MSHEGNACSNEEDCVNDGASKCSCTFCLKDFNLMQSRFDQAEKIPNTKKHARFRAFVASGLNRIGCVKDDKSLKYLGVTSFDTVIEHIQNKMDIYNGQQTGGEQMSFANIELDHIKPVKQFALELSHFTNLQPLLKKVNRSKAAKWTHTDDTFWKANIQHQPEFTDLYADTTIRLSGNNVHNNKNLFDRQQSQINRQRWKDMDCITTCEAKMIYQKWLHGSDNNTQFMDILATIKEVQYSQIQNNEKHLTNSRTQLKNIIKCDISKYKIYENIFIYPHMVKKFCNLMLGIYNQKKLKEINALNIQKDYIVKNIDTTNSKVLLLHDMITLVNQHLPHTTTKLEVFNLTLHQKNYKEEKYVDFADIMWEQFKSIIRTNKKKPETLRECIKYIYALSKKIFGKYFTDQRKTDRIAKSKRNKKIKITCYNYVTNESLLLCFIEMACWGDKDADDFHPDIVAKYKIKARIQKDQQAAILCIPSTVSDTVKVPVVYKVDTAAIFES